MEAVTLSWQLVQGLSNAHDFWLALRGCVSMAFHRELLQLTDSQAPALVATLKQVHTVTATDRESVYNRCQSERNGYRTPAAV